MKLLIPFFFFVFCSSLVSAGFEYNNLDLPKLTREGIDEHYFGGMYYHNDTGTTIPFDDASTWYNLYFTEADQLSGFTFDGGFGETSNLTVEVGGHYQATYMAIGSGQNNHIYLTTIRVNAVEQDKCGSHHKMASGGDVITQSGVCLLELEGGDVIEVVTQDYGATGDGVYYGGNLNLVRID